jgi:hypothetical protein
MGSHLNGVNPRVLTAPTSVSTSHLAQSDLDEPDFDVPGLYTQDLDEPDLKGPISDTQDIECAATNIHDVIPATIARYDSAASNLRDTDEGPNATPTSSQAPKRYRCGIGRLDGSPCHETFALKEKVYRHQKTSAHMRSVLCPFCPGRSRQPPTLFLHVQKLHPEKLWTDFRCRLCRSGRIYSMVGLGVHV